MNVKFMGIECVVNVAHFGNKRPALVLIDAKDYSPVARVSTNLPEVEIGENETAIKDWSENEGILDILVDAGVISEPIYYIESGFVQVPVCNILIPLK